MEPNDNQAENVVSKLIPKDINYQAAHWLGVLDGDAPSAENVAAFHRWKNEDEAHKKAFEELLELWGDTNILTRLEPPVRPAISFTGFFPVTRLGATAFAVLLLVTLSVFQYWDGSNEQVYITQVGEQKIIQLADNSEVTLNTDSYLIVDYQSNRRLLTLKRGEAHFEVTHNPKRPFDVYAGGGFVKAIGTAFTVRLEQDKVSVYVTEGLVEVFNEPESPLNSSLNSALNSALDSVDADLQANSLQGRSISSIRVPAGQQAVFSEVAIERVAVVPNKNMQEKLAWLQGNLVFKGEPLGDVIDEFSRYTSTRIIIPGKKMRSIKVGGIFKIGDTVAMLDALQEGFGIHAKYVSDDIVYLVFEEDK